MHRLFVDVYVNYLLFFELVMRNYIVKLFFNVSSNDHNHIKCCKLYCSKRYNYMSTNIDEII